MVMKKCKSSLPAMDLRERRISTLEIDFGKCRIFNLKGKIFYKEERKKTKRHDRNKWVCVKPTVH